MTKRNGDAPGRSSGRLRRYDSRLELVSEHRNLSSATRQVERVIAYAEKLGFHVNHSHVRGDDGSRQAAAEKRAAA